MKVYSYMQAGKGILATDIRSHTQALDRDCAELVAPDAASVAAGFDRLFDDGAYRTRLGLRAREKVEREYSVTAFKQRVSRVYARLATLQLAPSGDAR